MSRPRRFQRDVDGIVLLDKPLGLSSNAALQRVRSLFDARKAGHAGSLDPLATGMLPVCFGQATKVCGRLLNSGKRYRVLVQLGESTPSGDGETEVTERAPVPTLSAERVDAILAGFLGEQQQVPPMHSALKFEGKRLYELARRGETVERPARTITIHDIRRVGDDAQLQAHLLEFDAYCSKGTYIRTLAADVAAALGTLGHVKGLRRLAVDPFADLPMYSLEHLEALAEEGGKPALEALLLPVDTAFVDLPRVELDRDAVRVLLLGQTAPAHTPPQGECRLYGGERFLGLGEVLTPGRVKPQRLLVALAGSGGGRRR